MRSPARTSLSAGASLSEPISRTPIQRPRTRPRQGEPEMETHGSAVWQGGIKNGKGAISTKSGALKDYPYGFSSRFEGKHQSRGAHRGGTRRMLHDGSVAHSRRGQAHHRAHGDHGRSLAR